MVGWGHMRRGPAGLHVLAEDRGDEHMHDQFVNKHQVLLPDQMPTHTVLDGTAWTNMTSKPEPQAFLPTRSSPPAPILPPDQALGPSAFQHHTHGLYRLPAMRFIAC